MIMKENVGELDRNIRFIAGGALLATALTANIGVPWKFLALVLGASELLTATTRHCPLNSMLGIDTNREPEHTPREREEQAGQMVSPVTVRDSGSTSWMQSPPPTLSCHSVPLRLS